MEYFLYIILFIGIIIPILKSIDKDLEDKNVSCGCYLEREDLESQKECYFKSKK